MRATPRVRLLQRFPPASNLFETGTQEVAALLTGARPDVRAAIAAKGNPC